MDPTTIANQQRQQVLLLDNGFHAGSVPTNRIQGDIWLPEQRSTSNRNIDPMLAQLPRGQRQEVYNLSKYHTKPLVKDNGGPFGPAVGYMVGQAVRVNPINASAAYQNAEFIRLSQQQQQRRRQ